MPIISKISTHVPRFPGSRKSRWRVGARVYQPPHNQNVHTTIFSGSYIRWLHSHAQWTSQLFPNDAILSARVPVSSSFTDAGMP